MNLQITSYCHWLLQCATEALPPTSWANAGTTLSWVSPVLGQCRDKCRDSPVLGQCRDDPILK